MKEWHFAFPIDRKVTAQKMKTAGATGVLALQEHGLKEVPEGLFVLVKLRVRGPGRVRYACLHS